MFHRIYAALALMVLGLVLSTTVAAQMEGAAFLHTGKWVSTAFATDYQAIGINPANLGIKLPYEDKKVTFGLLEVSGSVYCDALTRKDINEHFLKDNNIKFNAQQKQMAATAFAGKDFTANIDVRGIGFTLHTDSAGAFAFQVMDRIQWYSTFGREASSILFQGYNAAYFDLVVLTTGDTVARADLTVEQAGQVRYGLASSPRRITQVMDGSTITHQWVREYALGWGRRMTRMGAWDLHAGITLRYLQGLGIMEISEDGGRLTAYSSLSPGYDINYGTASFTNPSALVGSGFTSVGKGFSGDIGLAMEKEGSMRFGLAVVNIGSITWNGNVYTAADEVLERIDHGGFDNYNFYDQAQRFFGDDGVLQWEGLKEKQVAMPMQLRAGGAFWIKEKTQVGFDVVVPMNETPGNLTAPMYGVGGEFMATPWLGLNTGLGLGGMYKTLVPFGLAFRSVKGGWEGGVATRDVLSLFIQDPGMVSYSFGFLRFRV
ncbi:MAG: hypothetical protein KIT10_03120 [Flavobacteriales bacterium]|nr:hypothetical protein [Flavobacteriales bacterium]